MRYRPRRRRLQPTSETPNPWADFIVILYRWHGPTCTLLFLTDRATYSPNYAAAAHWTTRQGGYAARKRSFDRSSQIVNSQDLDAPPPRPF
jgi:hypothetical protein